MEVTTFACSICGDASHKICVFCTKDACNNHLCHRCLCCSECCSCDMPTTDEENAETEPLALEEETATRSLTSF